MIALTGQVDTQVLGPGAFQEVDLAAAFGKVAQWAQPVLHGSRILEVENFVCLDLTGGRRAASTLLRATESCARNWNCSYIRLSLFEPRLDEGQQDRNRMAIELLEAAGYREESTMFGKSFLALG